MIVNLEYASQRQPDGRIFVKPFCYAEDDSPDEDGGSPVRDVNYAQHLTRRFTENMPGQYSLDKPDGDWNPVFRIVLEVSGVRNNEALYHLRSYERLDFAAVYNGVCQNYMELYHALKKICKRAKKRKEVITMACKSGKKCKGKGGCKGK